MEVGRFSLRLFGHLLPFEGLGVSGSHLAFLLEMGGVELRVLVSYAANIGGGLDGVLIDVKLGTSTATHSQLVLFKINLSSDVEQYGQQKRRMDVISMNFQGSTDSEAM